jgi:hypothetical protein
MKSEADITGTNNKCVARQYMWLLHVPLPTLNFESRERVQQSGAIERSSNVRL